MGAFARVMNDKTFGSKSDLFIRVGLFNVKNVECKLFHSHITALITIAYI